MPKFGQYLDQELKLTPAYCYALICAVVFCVYANSLRVPYLFDDATMRQFQHVKRAFDPQERINAGKLIPSDKVRVSLLKPTKPGRHVPQ